MDPCNPNTNVENARSTLRSNMGVPKRYAKTFSKKMICNAFRKCKRSNVFPPMAMKMVDGYVYLIDSHSPLTAKEYRLLFEIGKKSDIVKIAKKLGVVELDKPIGELKSDIISILDNMDILEPIKAMKVEKKKEMVMTNGNMFNNKNMFNGNGNNGGTNNKNLFNGNGNNGGTNNKNLFNGNVNTNTNNKNMFNGNVNTNTNKNRPGRPVVKIPSVRINANNNGNINNLRNFVKTPKVNRPTNNKKTNMSNLAKTIESIKNELGVPPSNTGTIRSTVSTAVPSALTSTASRSVVPSAVSTVAPGQYTKNNLNHRSVEQLRRIGVREFGLSTTTIRRPGYGKNRLVTNILNRQRTKLGSVREE